MTKLFQIEGIGEVKVTKYKRSKRIKIAVNPKREVNVIIPYFVSYDSALGFVREKLPWIRRTQQKIQNNTGKQLLDEHFKLDVHNKSLSLQPERISWVRIHHKSDKYIIFYPQHLNVADENLQSMLKSAITETLRMEAKLILPQRTYQLAKKHGFSYSGVSIKNLRSRWGSCSATNNINLNLHLIRLPKHLTDYVILHELVHTKHKNHSPVFWDHLNKVLKADARRIQNEMRDYHPETINGIQISLRH